MFKKLSIFTLLCCLFSSIFSQALEVDSSEVIKVKNKIENIESGTSYDPLPLGTILMYSGDSWEDDETIPGWYACTKDKGIVNNIQIPNLEDRFIIGSPMEKVQDVSIEERMGGADNNKITLSVKELPKHYHNIDHNHYKISVSTSDHTHSYSDTYRPHNGKGVGGGDAADVQDDNGNTSSSKTSGEGGAHSHVVDLPPLSKDCSEYINDASNKDYSSGTTGENSPIDITPAFYRVIYIIKVKK